MSQQNLLNGPTAEYNAPSKDEVKDMVRIVDELKN